MQINKIGSIVPTFKNYQNNIKSSKQISFGGVDCGCGFIYGIKSKSDKIDETVQEKIEFANRIKEEGKKLLKKAKGYYREGENQQFQPFPANEPLSYVVFTNTANDSKPSHMILKKTTASKDIASEEYFFDMDNKNHFSRTVILKHNDNTTKEYIFHKNNLISYKEKSNNGSYEKYLYIPMTNRKSFIYKEGYLTGEKPETAIYLSVSGKRKNKDNIVKLNENGDNITYTYSEKSKKWRAVKKNILKITKKEQL